MAPFCGGQLGLARILVGLIMLKNIQMRTAATNEFRFLDALAEIAITARAQAGSSESEIVSEVDSQRQHTNLSSALRLFVLDFYRRHASDKGGTGDKPRLGPCRGQDCAREA
jgi:predicted DNA-binding ribbon-helix-helix protein